MNEAIRKVQFKLLKVFSTVSENFALSGGTALELFYFKHRFSRDLGFFSPKYSFSEMDKIVVEFNKCLRGRLKLENELSIGGKVKVRFIQ